VTTADAIHYRRPSESDYPAIVGVIDDWWGERGADAQLPRLWLRHFTGTSWLAESADGRPAGVLIGFLSPDRPAEACCLLLGTSPNLRRQGIAGELMERFVADARRAGRTRIVSVVWPAARACVAFHRSAGFEPEAGPGVENLYGTPAFAGYDFGREDRAVLVRNV
jgi:GNAT superfamily N-acetyltransferase